MNWHLTRATKYYVITLIVVLIFTPLVLIKIKIYQAGADIQTPPVNNTGVNFNTNPSADNALIPENEPFFSSSDFLIKNDTTKLYNVLQGKIDSLINQKQQDYPKSFIVKMKASKDINQAQQTLLGQQNQKVGIKTIKNFIDVNRIASAVEEQKQKKPEMKDQIAQKFSSLNLDKIFIIEINDQQDLETQIALFKNNPGVEYAQVNHVVRISSVPNDPYYSSSNSWGQGYDDLWGLKKIQPEQAWDRVQGEGVTVAVVDTGIDYNHEDLSSNIWLNPNEIANNSVDDDNNGFVDDAKGYDFYNRDSDPQDGHGHGTHVSGTIAALMNNSRGMAGVAPRAKIMAVKGLSDSGYGDDATLAEAIIYAANNGAKVINASWGGSGQAPVLEDAITYVREIQGAVFVAAAGNYNSDTANFHPANIPGVVTVSSTDHNDQKSDFSNWGNNVKLAAPGGDSTDPNDSDAKYANILSLRANNTDIYRDGKKIVGNYYYRARGTSMATPHISGAAALIFSIREDINYRVVEEVLFSSADDLGNQDWDKYYGYGRVNVSQAITLIENMLTDSQPPTSPTNFNGQAIHTRQIDLTWSAATDETFLVGYKIYRDGVEIGSTAKTNLTDDDVSQGTTYRYDVRAYDINNQSEAVSISVATPIDSTPPTVPANLKAKAFINRVDLKWTPSADDYYLAGYKIYRNGIELANISPEASQFSDFDVLTDQTYTYKVQAYDLESNLSQFSNQVTATIPQRLFADSSINLQDVSDSKTLAWGDYDNDGDLDVAYGGGVGWRMPDYVRIYRNDGNSVFSNIITGLPKVIYASVEWGDFDRDQDLDLLIAGSDYSDTNGDHLGDKEIGFVKIYRNNGGNNFTFYADISPLADGEAKWADLDSDGDLDIVLTAYDPDARDMYHANFLKIFKNNNNTFSDVTPGVLTGLNGSLSAADYDNDGDLDLINSGGQKLDDGWRQLANAFLYVNTSTGNNFNFTPNATTLPYLADGSSAWGDYDNDGDLDLVITGRGSVFNRQPTVIIIYKNDRGFLTEVTSLNALSYSGESIAWGDYDNDGDLDLVSNGYRYVDIPFPNIQPDSKIFRNDGSNEFVDIGPELPRIGGGYGAVSWADYDNDGDLDITIGGLFYQDGQYLGRDVKIFKNQSSQPNQKPGVSLRLMTNINADRSVDFIWYNASQGRMDAETPYLGLYANFRLGTTPGSQNIVSGRDSTPLMGSHLRPRLSPKKLSVFGRRIRNLASGTYYWSAQMIDSGLRTSDWYPEQTFIIP